MFPLQNTYNHREVNYLTKFTPIRGTSFEYMLNSIYTSTGTKVCLAGSIQDVSQEFDTMLNTKNCKNVHRYIVEEKYDVEGVERLLRAEFGESEINQTKLELEARFGRYPETLRDHLTLLDAMISELYFTGNDPDARLPSYSR